MITENGFAGLDWVGVDGAVHDPQRIDFTRRYLAELAHAIGDGVDVRGYFHWSLMDNFEWADGYRQRFGLIHVDYKTLRRTPKDSARWYANVIRTNGREIIPDQAPAIAPQVKVFTHSREQTESAARCSLTFIPSLFSIVGIHQHRIVELYGSSARSVRSGTDHHQRPQPRRVCGSTDRQASPFLAAGELADLNVWEFRVTSPRSVTDSRRSSRSALPFGPWSECRAERRSKKCKSLPVSTLTSCHKPDVSSESICQW